MGIYRGFSEVLDIKVADRGVSNSETGDGKAHPQELYSWVLRIVEKRVIFPHPTFLNGILMAETSVHPWEATPWFKAGFCSKPENKGQNGAERQETPPCRGPHP